MTPTTRRIRHLAGCVFSQRTLERLIDPVLADIELERRQALGSGRVWLARRVVFSGYVALIRALAVHGAYTLVRGDGAAHIVRSAAAAFIVLTVVLLLPPLHRAPQIPSFAALAVYLIPQAIPLSVPLAIAFAIARSTSRNVLNRTASRTALALALVGTSAVLVSMEWLTPAANDAFRSAVTARLAREGKAAQVPRGLSERPLSELTLVAWYGRAALKQDDHVRYPLWGLETVSPEHDWRFTRAVHRVLALPFASAAFGLMGAAILAAIRRRTLLRIALVAVAPVYIAALFATSAIPAPVPAALWAWAPNITMVLIAAVLFVSTRRDRADGRVARTTGI